MSRSRRSLRLPSSRLLCFAVFFLLGASAIAAEGGPTGLWDRDDGLGGVRIVPCGGALCGHVVWLRDEGGPAHIGQRVLFGMHRTGQDTWSGSAVNPSDGQTYAGTMTLSGSRLLTRGCALGGMVCQSVALSRAH